MPVIAGEVSDTMTAPVPAGLSLASTTPSPVAWRAGLTGSPLVAEPPMVSLLTSTTTVSGDGAADAVSNTTIDPVTGREVRWVAGLAADWEGDVPASGFSQCISGVNTQARNGQPEGAGITGVLPLWVDAREVRGAFDDPDDAADRIARACDANTAWRLERELWTGEVVGGQRLASTGTPASPVAAVLLNGGTAYPTVKAGLAALELALAPLPGAAGTSGVLTGASAPGRPGTGAPGMLHCAVDLLPYAAGVTLDDATNYMADRKGRTFAGRMVRTQRGNIIVPGEGYPGTGPSGQQRTDTQSWVFATDRIVTFLGPIDTATRVVSRSTDTVIDRATRPTAYGCPWIRLYAALITHA